MRLHFGTNSASKLFQNVIYNQVHDIPGVIDVIVYGKSQEDHDNALHTMSQHFTKISLMLNKEKCQFNENKLRFFGIIFSSEGISADPAKVDFVKNAALPHSVKGIHSFLGMVTYCAKFIPNFSDLSKPSKN